MNAEKYKLLLAEWLVSGHDNGCDITEEIQSVDDLVKELEKVGVVGKGVDWGWCHKEGMAVDDLAGALEVVKEVEEIKSTVAEMAVSAEERKDTGEATVQRDQLLHTMTSVKERILHDMHSLIRAYAHLTTLTNQLSSSEPAVRCSKYISTLSVADPTMRSLIIESLRQALKTERRKMASLVAKLNSDAATDTQQILNEIAQSASVQKQIESSLKNEQT
eukprot:TRINITY_DN34845_c0_g1_i1.p1 TRINITY_DN34845_c0_g1~~TRINITY_DN34845_c0_g1_i1.p1  ORF type:complete len:219 (+),score=16.66 TRINITY_DN34845_c0_g1_i1:47-703(+)